MKSVFTRIMLLIKNLYLAIRAKLQIEVRFGAHNGVSTSDDHPHAIGGPKVESENIEIAGVQPDTQKDHIKGECK